MLDKLKRFLLKQNNSYRRNDVAEKSHDVDCILELNAILSKLYFGAKVKSYGIGNEYKKLIIPMDINGMKSEFVLHFIPDDLEKVVDIINDMFGLKLNYVHLFYNFIELENHIARNGGTVITASSNGQKKFCIKLDGEILSKKAVFSKKWNMTHILHQWEYDENIMR